MPPFALVSSTVSTLRAAAAWLPHYGGLLATPSLRLHMVPEAYRDLVAKAAGDRCFQDYAEFAVDLARVRREMEAHFQR